MKNGTEGVGVAGGQFSILHKNTHMCMHIFSMTPSII